jgi:ATP-dependent Clp protease ATP-binding subunit ClpC
MENVFYVVLFAILAGVGGYLAGRSRREAPPATPPTPSKKSSAELTAELRQVAAPVDRFFESAATPSEILSHPSFEEAVRLLNSGPWSDEDLLAYYTGDRAVLAFLALEALTRREGGTDVREAVIESINNFIPWSRYFSLRLLDKRTPPGEALVGRLLVRLNDSWEHPANIKILQDFLRTRADRGEALTLGDHTDRLNDGTAENLVTVLSSMPAEIKDKIIADIEAWRASRIDREFLDGVGRVWRDGDEYEAEGPVLDHDVLTAHVETVEAAILARPRRSVLLVGEQGVGKTAIVRALGRRLSRRSWIVFEAGHPELVAGQIYIGQLEERVRELLVRVQDRPILWYVPDFHALALAGRHRYGPLSALDILLPHVEQGKIVLLGETEPQSFERLVQRKPRVLTAMEVDRVDPLSDTLTTALVDRWAAEHAGGADAPGLPPEIRREAWQLAQQYLGDRAAPGNVLQLLNLTRLRLTTTNPEAPLEIGVDDMITTLTQLTGLPATILDERRGLDLASLRELFERRVLGQGEAVDCLVERVAMIKAGVTDPTRPSGVFLFAGPTGTGKTEIAKTLAEFLFGSSERMIRLDMSEFQEAESLSRIIGESEEEQRGGALVDRIRKQPFSVVLLDEFEKAHRNIWDLFLQLFDDGRLTDRSGNTADFRNAIVIMTSNLGSVIPSGASLGFADGTGRFNPKVVLREVERSFRKEFLNRIDRIVVFRALSRETMREIVRKELADAFQRRGLRNRAWAVEWEDSALDLLLDKGFTADLGARPLKRAIDRHLLAPLAVTIIDHSYPEGDQFLFVRAEKGRLVVDFVDPDAPDVEAAAVAEAGGELLRSAGEHPPVGRIALDPHGTPDELAALEAEHARLDGIAGEASWQESKRAGLERTRSQGFWSSPERFAVLGQVEYLDRIEAGLKSAGSLLERLRGTGARARERFPRKVVGRLARQLYLLDAACAGVLAGEPRDAFLQVEAWSDTGTPSRNSDAFARRIGAMYRAWAEKSRMQSEVLRASGPESDRPYRLLVAVSGYAAWRLLTSEAGLHVLELPERKGKGFRRAVARVRVVPQPEIPPERSREGPLEQAREALAVHEGAGVAIVRRYREEPSPLVRDAVHGWRTGHLDRVLGGDFDLLAKAQEQSPA